MTRTRATVLLCLISTIACTAVAGPAAFAAQRTGADIEAGGEIGVPEEPPPVVETPTETEAPAGETEAPPVETPVTTPPGGTPAAGEGVTPAAESAKGGSAGGSEPSSGGGGSSTGSGPSPTTTTTTGATTTHHTSTHVRSHPASGGGGTKAGTRTGTGASGGVGDESSGGGRHAPATSGGASHDPTVSPQQIDEGASAVSHAAAHVGEVFANALPAAPVKKLGTRVAAHLGLVPARGGKAQNQAVDRLGTALGAALIGSAVAVEKKPSASHLPIPFFEPPAPKSATLYLVLIAVLLLGIGALVFREVRSALGLSGPRTGVRIADEKPRLGTGMRAGAALSRARYVGERGLMTFRRFSANAVSGVRSLF